MSPRFSPKELYKKDLIAPTKKAKLTKIVKQKGTITTDSLSAITAKRDTKYETKYVSGVKYMTLK